MADNCELRGFPQNCKVATSTFPGTEPGGSGAATPESFDMHCTYKGDK